MPIVINEFEAVVEPPPREEPGPPGEPRPEATAAAALPPPADLDDVLRQRLERLARLVAD